MKLALASANVLITRLETSSLKEQLHNQFLKNIFQTKNRKNPLQYVLLVLRFVKFFQSFFS